ncbi:hypothetical protein KC322_g37 [Hortaea werneckii]|nr:hypothetical protein KC322_g37 [Hortaea werneckii]
MDRAPPSPLRLFVRSSLVDPIHSRMTRRRPGSMSVLVTRSYNNSGRKFSFIEGGPASTDMQDRVVSTSSPARRLNSCRNNHSFMTLRARAPTEPHLACRLQAAANAPRPRRAAPLHDRPVSRNPPIAPYRTPTSPREEGGKAQPTGWQWWRLSCFTVRTPPISCPIKVATGRIAKRADKPGGAMATH